MTIPEVIASGCDVILFADEPERDMERVRRALADGRIPAARLEDALRRILGAQGGARAAPAAAARPRGGRAALATPESLAEARAVTARVPTLVKDVSGLLPLDPARHRRVLVYSGGIVHPLAPAGPFVLPDLLAREGFEVTLHARGSGLEPRDFDLVLYLFGDETLLTRSAIFIDWMKLTGNLHGAMDRPWHDVPTLMISFGYPYLLYDAPRVPAYVNAYGDARPRAGGGAGVPDGARALRRAKPGRSVLRAGGRAL